MQFGKSRGGGVGGGGGVSAPPPFASLSDMILFSSLLPPKAISCGFSILCVGEDAFTHLFALQRRVSFTLLCFLAFYSPANTSGFRLLVCRRRRFIHDYFIFLAFNPLKRFRVAFSFLCVGEDVFIHFFTA